MIEYNKKWFGDAGEIKINKTVANKGYNQP